MWIFEIWDVIIWLKTVRLRPRRSTIVNIESICVMNKWMKAQSMLIAWNIIILNLAGLVRRLSTSSMSVQMMSQIRRKNISFDVFVIRKRFFLHYYGRRRRQQRVEKFQQKPRKTTRCGDATQVSPLMRLEREWEKICILITASQSFL